MPHSQRDEPRVYPADRRAAEFLTEYRALCRRHRIMVIAVEDDDGNTRFAVALVDDDPGSIDKAIQEMLVGRPVRFSWPDEPERRRH